jgi:WD40 repeat protein
MNKIKKFNENGYLLKKFDKELTTLAPLSRESDMRHSVVLGITDTLPLRSAIVSDDGILIITSTVFPLIRGIDLKNNGEVLFDNLSHERTVRNIYIDQDRGVFFSGSWDGSAMMFNLRTGEKLMKYSGHNGRIPMLKSFKDKLYVANYTGDINPLMMNSLSVYDIETGSFISQIARHGLRKGVETIGLCFDAAKDLLYTGSDDGKVYKRSLTGEILLEFCGHEDSIRNVSLNPDGSILATSCSDRRLRLFETEGGKLIGSALLPNETLDAKFSDNKIIVACWNGTAYGFDLNTLEQKTEYSGHWSSIWTLNLCNNNKTVVTASVDGSVGFFDIKGELICLYVLLKDPNDFLWISFPNNENQPEFYTNNPQRYIKVFRISQNGEQIKVSDSEAQEYYNKHNNKALIGKILNFDYYSEMQKKAIQNKQLNDISINMLSLKENQSSKKN